MDDQLERQLTEIFGGNMNVAPGGTGAVLTTPSELDLEIAGQSVKAMPLDGLYRDFGAVAARVVADELESRQLRAADYAALEELPRLVSKRIVGYLLRSDEFSRSFRRHLAARG
jgi:hypothetical protein